MSTRRDQVRRATLALGISTSVVVLVAWLLPRAFVINDDPGLVVYLRSGVFTPWISPPLVNVLIAAYRYAPDVAWYGLFQYALVAISGAIVIHSCMELIDGRSGVGRAATLIGTCAFCASEVVFATGLTWTMVSIYTIGVATAALVAHLQISMSGGRTASIPRALFYGLIASLGYMLRPSGLAAMLAALLPLFGWLAFAVLRQRRLPRPLAVLAAIAPIALTLTVEHRIPQAPGAERDPINYVRGQLHGQTAYDGLASRAPELLARAGWTVEEYNDFNNWNFINDRQFTLAKLKRLVDTGGVPTPITPASVATVLREIVNDSPTSVWLFLATLAGVLALAWLGAIDPLRGVVFGVGYLVFAAAVPQWMASVYRFPQRVSLPYVFIAAFALFVILAREVAARPAEAALSPAMERRAGFALGMISVLLFAWARNVIVWADRPVPVVSPEARAFIARMNARNGFVLPQAGVAEFDPLVPDAAGYTGLPAGWGTFTSLWYDYLARFGLQHGDQVLPWMLDNPDAYVMATLGSRPAFEDWVTRQLVKPVRLAVVDVAGAPQPAALALFRVVTTPLVPGSAEWKVLEASALTQANWVTGPPSTDGLPFQPVSFAPPYARHASQLRAAAAGVALEPVTGGLRCTTADLPAAVCDLTDAGGQHAGVRAEVHGLRAARFELTLIEPANIISVHVLAESTNARSRRWRWDLSDETKQFGYHGAFTVVPGYPGRLLRPIGGSAAPADITALHIYVTVVPGKRAGFELRNLEVAAP